MKLQSDISARAMLISKTALFTCLAPGLRRLKKLGVGVAQAFSMWFLLTIFPYVVVRLPGFLMW